MSSSIRRGKKLDAKHFVANRIVTPDSLSGKKKFATAVVKFEKKDKEADVAPIMSYLKAVDYLLNDLVAKLSKLQASGAVNNEEKIADAKQQIENLLISLKFQQLQNLLVNQQPSSPSLLEAVEINKILNRADLTQYPELVGHSSRTTVGFLRVGATVIENTDKDRHQQSVHDEVVQGLADLFNEHKNKWYQKNKPTFAVQLQQALTNLDNVRKQAKRDIWRREKNNAAILYEYELKQAGFTFTEEDQEYFKDIKDLCGYNELSDKDRVVFDNLKKESDEYKARHKVVLQTKRDALRANRRVVLQEKQFAKRIKVNITNKERQKKLFRLNNYLSEAAQRKIDPDYEHAPLTKAEKVRLNTKRFLIVVGAIGASLALLGLIGLAGVSLFTPFAPFTLYFGYVGMSGLLPLIDTFATSVINAWRFKRAPNKIQVAEMRAASIALPAVIASSSIISLGGRLVQAVANFFSHKSQATSVMQATNVAAKDDKVFAMNSFGTFVNATVTGLLTWLYRKLTQTAHHKGQLKDREYVSFANAKQLLNSNAQGEDRLKLHAAAVNKTKAGHGRTYVYNSIAVDKKDVQIVKAKRVQFNTNTKFHKKGDDVKHHVDSHGLGLFKLHASEEFKQLRKEMNGYKMLDNNQSQGGAGASYDERTRQLKAVETQLSKIDSTSNFSKLHPRDFKKIELEIKPFIEAERVVLDRIGQQLSQEDKSMHGRLILAYR